MVSIIHLWSALGIKVPSRTGLSSPLQQVTLGRVAVIFFLVVPAAYVSLGQLLISSGKQQEAETVLLQASQLSGEGRFPYLPMVRGENIQDISIF